MNSHGRPRLSLCMIVKDEATTIERCLASVRGVVDEIVVHDTGSSDDTVALAEAAGATVIRGEWHDDFARARNVALDACSGDWILHLDADEELAGDLRAVSRALRARPDLDGYLVTIRNVGTARGDTEHANMRLFRRGRLRWQGRLHEQVVRDDGRKLRGAVLEGAHVLHHGYAQDAVDAQSKPERNLRIATAALAECADGPERGRLLSDVGRSLSATGDPAGALDHFRQAREVAEGNDLLTALRLGTEILLDRGELDEAQEWVDAFAAAGGGSDMVQFLRGSIELFSGRGGRTLVALDRPGLVVEGPSGSVTAPVLHHRLGLAHAADGSWGPACEHLVAALSDTPAAAWWAPAIVAVHRSGGDLGRLTSLVSHEGLRTVVSQAAGVDDDAARDAFGHALLERFGPDPVIVAFATSHARRLQDLEAMLPWAAVVRASGLDLTCPLIERATDPTIPAPDRFMAAVVVHAAFRDPAAAGLLHDISDELRPEDEAAAVHVLHELAPDLLSAD